MDEPSQNTDPQPEERKRPRSWISAVLWVVLPAALLAVGWLVLGACGLAWPTDGKPFLTFCPEAEARDPRLAVLEAERDREHALEDELQRVRLALVAAPDCPVPVVEAPPEEEEPPITVAMAPPEPPPEPVPELEPEQPNVPLPVQRPTPPPLPPEPEITPEPVVQEPPPPPLPAEDIPEEAWEDRDVSFLEGCWSLTSDYRLREINTGQVTTVNNWQMCFDENGGGSQQLTFTNGVQCSGPVEAQFGGSQLNINDLVEVTCSDGTRIFRRVIDCSRGSDGTADCTSVQPSRPNSGAEVSFQR